MVPIAWALLPNKTAEAYKALLRHLKDELGIEPEKIMCDFEAGCRVAAYEVYPGVPLVRCRFHHSQVSDFAFDILEF